MAGDFAADAADDAAFFDGDEEFVVDGELGEAVEVEGFGKAHVDDGGVKRLAGFVGGGDHAAEGGDGDAFAAAQGVGFAVLDGGWGVFGEAGGEAEGAARVADGGGAGVVVGGGEHVPAFGGGGGTVEGEVGDAVEVGEVERAVVGGAVCADEAGAVDGEHDGEVLQGDVVDELVVGALEEGGVDGDDGFEAAAGEAGGEGEGVLFGDADVVVAVGVGFGVADHAGAFAHGGGNGDEAVVLGGGVAEPVAEDLGTGGGGGGGAGGNAGGVVEAGDAMVEDGVGFGELVALAFAGDDVEESRPFDFAYVLEHGDESVEIVSVDGAVVVEAEFFEEGAGGDETLHVLFDAAGDVFGGGEDVEDFGADTAGSVPRGAGEHPR